MLPELGQSIRSRSNGKINRGRCANTLAVLQPIACIPLVLSAGSALAQGRLALAELAPKYEIGEPAPEHPPLSVKQFLWLINNAAEIHARLDVLCRFVLVLRGIAKDSYDEVATQLGISLSAAEQAYCVAFDSLTMVAKLDLCSAGLPTSDLNNEDRTTGSAA